MLFPRSIPLACKLLALLLTVVFSTAVHAAEYNPRFFFLVEGDLIGGRTLILGDNDDWNFAPPQLPAQSKGKKVSVSLDQWDNTKGLKVEFNKRSTSYGIFSLSNIAQDLSAFENNAAIALDLKLHTRPTAVVNLGIDCGYPCKAEVNIRKTLAGLKREQFITVPIALNCFKGDGFTLSTVNAISLATSGQLSVSIANIRLEKLPDGEKGCAD